MDGTAQKQLSFERLYLNRSVEKIEPKSQAAVQIKIIRQQTKNILAALKKGPLTTYQLRSMAAQYNTRIRELRHWLQPQGLTIDCIPKAGGNNLFEIVPFSGSRYQGELMRKAANAASKI